MTSESDLIEARERRRAKILASKDARMSRITGVHKGSSSESLHVDEVVLQEYIAEGKKHAVELAKEDYIKTHKENDSKPDDLLSPEQIKEKQAEQLKSQLARLHENSPASKLELFLASLVVIILAVSAAFFTIKKTAKEFSFCFNFGGIVPSKIETCRNEILPLLLQHVPASLAMALVPILSDVFKRRKPVALILASVLTRSILFFVVFLLSIRILQ